MIKVKPYMIVDGIPTFPDSVIKSFWDQMEVDGTIETVFCDGKINTREQWLANVKSGGTVFCIAIRDGDPVGLGWINRMEKKKAWGHFCLFSNGWGLGSEQIGKAMLNFFFGLDNGKAFDIFMGMLPTSNQAAVAYLVKCGANIIGKVRNGLWNEHKGESESATLIYFERPA